MLVQFLTVTTSCRLRYLFIVVNLRVSGVNPAHPDTLITIGFSLRIAIIQVGDDHSYDLFNGSRRECALCRNMDPELQALREARLAELKRGTQGSGRAGENGKSAGGESGVGAIIAAYLQPQALERLSRVSLVRPDRAQAVEQYLARMVSQGALSHKVTEDEIVQILHGIAREQNKKNETKIIFDRREMAANDQLPDGGKDDDDDDFFD